MRLKLKSFRRANNSWSSDINEYQRWKQRMVLDSTHLCEFVGSNGLSYYSGKRSYIPRFHLLLFSMPKKQCHTKTMLHCEKHSDSTHYSSQSFDSKHSEEKYRNMISARNLVFLLHSPSPCLSDQICAL